ncbi:MAG: ABC transporter permease, partial [Rhodospirillaceae bacterium]|nr:ABC transporter permease [Rhodospirillaceae bacterium]
MSATSQDRDPVPHYVNREAFNPYVDERLTAEQERYYMASQWRMMWWK